MAKKESLNDFGDAELFEKLAKSKDELFHLRFQSVTGQLDNSARRVLRSPRFPRRRTRPRQM